jgi:hypothetical protein
MDWAARAAMADAPLSVAVLAGIPALAALGLAKGAARLRRRAASWRTRRR